MAPVAVVVTDTSACGVSVSPPSILTGEQLFDESQVTLIERQRLALLVRKQRIKSLPDAEEGVRAFTEKRKLADQIIEALSRHAAAEAPLPDRQGPAHLHAIAGMPRARLSPAASP